MPDPLQRQDLGEQLAEDLLLGRPRGAVASPLCRSGAGSALRSSLPLGVSGSASSTTKAAGTMYSGSRAARWRRSAAGSGARSGGRDHVGDQLLAARAVVARHHRRLGHRRAAAASAASISPGSMRKPRIFTWSSARPRNSSVPSARHRARSPVRYIRVPGSGRAGRRRTARRSSPGGPGSRAPAPRRRCTARRDADRAPARSRGVQDVDLRVGDRTADRDRASSRPRPGRQSTRWSSRSGRTGSTGSAPWSSSRSARSRGSASPPQSIVNDGLTSASPLPAASATWRASPAGT